MARREASTDPRAVRTREALMNATLTLLKDHPVSELSVTSIVREAEVSRQVFYEHFTDRDAVVLAAGREIIGPLYKEFVDEFNPDETYPDQVARLFARFAEHEDAVRRLMDSPAEGKLNDLAVNILVEPVHKALTAHLEQANLKVDDAMVEQTAYFLAAGTHGVFARGFAERASAEEVARRIEHVRRTLGAYSMGQAL